MSSGQQEAHGLGDVSGVNDVMVGILFVETRNVVSKGLVLRGLEDVVHFDHVVEVVLQNLKLLAFGFFPELEDVKVQMVYSLQAL